MRKFNRLERVLGFAMAASAAMQNAGCGGNQEAPVVQVDEVREKALTESMRGYFDNENKKENRKEAKTQAKNESNP